MSWQPANHGHHRLLLSGRLGSSLRCSDRRSPRHAGDEQTLPAEEFTLGRQIPKCPARNGARGAWISWNVCKLRRHGVAGPRRNDCDDRLRSLMVVGCGLVTAGVTPE